MEDILDLSISKKRQEFVDYGLSLELDISIDIAETMYEIPYVGSLLKFGKITNKFQQLHFIRKLALFLEKENGISVEEKDRFFERLKPQQRKLIHEYLSHYLLRAEDDDKADIMGYIYKERVYGKITDEMFLRLCSIIDKVFIFDLRFLPCYVSKNEEYTLAANNLINLGLIDNFVGGVWVDKPIYELNEVGKILYGILNSNGWYTDKRLMGLSGIS